MTNKHKAEALIIAEITGSITAWEQHRLKNWRKRCLWVRILSKELHDKLDDVSAEMMESRTTAAQIIEKGNAQLARAAMSRH
jgi:DNA-binding GntR family transcriptional regulator